MSDDSTNFANNFARKERSVMNSIIELYKVIQRNKQRNCAKKSNECNYEDPEPFFVEALNSIEDLINFLKWPKTGTDGNITTTSYSHILEQYNILIEYAMHMFEPSLKPKVPVAAEARVPPTPMHSFITADTIPAKINFAKSQLFGYN
jgi:hypothetical protein